jgi:hypothetical protein
MSPDELLEVLAVEYRLYTQKSGKAPAKLLINTQDAHRFGTAVLDRFKAEVAPNISLQIDAHVPEGRLYFLCGPEDLGLITRPPKWPYW